MMRKKKSNWTDYLVFSLMFVVAFATVSLLLYYASLVSHMFK